jgi:DNA-binding Lrp family transcriptional regulator
MRAIFVMIKCEMGQAYRVAQQAADRIPEMSELFSTSGQYDLLGKFYLEPQQDTGLFVTEHIQTLPGVKDSSPSMPSRAVARRYRRAIMSISTRASRARPVTPMQVRAGRRPGAK